MQPLSPFKPQPWLADTQLSGVAQWKQGHLHVRFALHAPEDAVRRSSGCGAVRRCDALWQSTCFEAFLAVPGEEHYWEINLSPCGHWNVYALSGYRRNLTAEPSIKALPYSLRAQPGELHVAFWLDLRGLVAPQSALELSLSAVLDHPRHGCSYWAWQHSGSEADFHCRSSFQLQKPAS